MKKAQNRIRSNNARTIKRSFSRFISLAIMSLLGMLVFVGLASSAPDMISTLDRYLDGHNVYDIKLVSSLGFGQPEVDAVAAVEGVFSARGDTSADIIITWGNNEAVMSIAALPQDINSVDLIEGRLPERADEIAVETNFLRAEGFSIGESFSADSDKIKENELTIVGTVDSALYYNNVKFDSNRGYTNVGSGKVNYYAYMIPEALDIPAFTAIYATVDGASGLLTSGSEYTEAVNAATERVEQIKPALESSRYEALRAEAEDQLAEIQAEAEERLSDGRRRLEEAEAMLAEAQAALDAGKAELEKNRSELEATRAEIEAAGAQLENTGSYLSAQRAQLEAEKAEAERKLSEFEAALASKGLSREDLMDALVTLKLSIETQSQYPGLEDQVAYLQSYYDSLVALAQQRDSADYAMAAYSAAYEEYGKAEAEYEAAYAEYSANLAAFNEASASFSEAESEYEREEELYERQNRLYHAGLNQYEEGVIRADVLIGEARDAIDSLKPPTVYVYDRTEYSVYSDYIDDSNSIRNLATLFPAVFFAVAVLVSLISMNKMVEEDRLEIGTMKSLGFSSKMIMSKYLSFSLWATVIGGILGTAAGMIAIPALIINIYSILFDVPGICFTFQPLYVILGFIITVICVCGSSVWTAYQSLRLKPAELMRPKAPPAGHRVLLERIKPLWKRLSFSRKIMLRNLFLYKKRVIVTIGGIACCTALILTGFGIKDSIVDLPSMQYYDIYQFDGTCYVNELSLSGASGSLSLSRFLENDMITGAAAAQRVTADLAGNDGYILAVEPEDLKYIAVFESASDGRPLTLTPGKVIIDEKLASLEKLSVGDTLHIVDVNNVSCDVEISGIARNWFEHYAYMDVSTFEQFNTHYSPNLVYFQAPGLTGPEKQQLSQELLAFPDVLNIAYRDEMIDTVDKGLRSLDSVVLILIVLSAMLAFVVLYNLATINISERRREIATLKVLGFYDGEVDGYISRETVILSVIGILLGLVLGIFLSRAVVNTIEVDKARFLNVLKPKSFVFSAVMSAVFSLAVAFITHFRLKRIDMIESLKSVE